MKRSVTLRRFLVFQSFLLWQGGFVFYAAFVVPAGTEVLGSARTQGFVTQTVTNALNLCGVAWVLFLGLDWFAYFDRNPVRRRVRGLAWLVTAGLLTVLFVLHRQLDAHIDAETGSIRDLESFRFTHGAYLVISTVQWLLTLGIAWLTLRAWSAEDRQHVLTTAPEPAA